MKFFTIQKKKGKEYVCVEDRARIDGKVQRTYFKYLGPREMFPDLPIGKSSTLLPPITKDSFETKPFEFGISAALWTIAQELDLPQIINAIIPEHDTPNLTTGEYLTLAAINRIADPGSESHLAVWFRRSWLSTQFDIDPSILNAQTYWNAFHRIKKTQMEEIECGLATRIRDRFGLQWDHLLYDTTNFFTYSKVDATNGLRNRGHAKQHCANLPLVNFFLVCAKPWGIPLLHGSYPGNTQDAKEFKVIPAKISNHLGKLGFTPENLTLYFDKGNLSPKAFESIDAEHLHFVASIRNSMEKDLLHIPRTEFTKARLPQTNKEIEYYRLTRIIYEQERTVIVLIDPANEKKHRLDFAKMLQKRQAKIDAFLQTQLNHKKWRNEAKVKFKMKLLIGKAPWNEIFTYTLLHEDDQIKIDLTIEDSAKQTFMETFGRSILFTNQSAWSAEEIIWAYREQYIIEHAFKAMKNPAFIAIRPMFVSSPKSIEGHVFVCVLALILMSVLHLKLARKSVYLSYPKIKDQLSHIGINQIYPTDGSESFFKMDKIPVQTVKLVQLLHLDQRI
jgi:transposase